MFGSSMSLPVPMLMNTSWRATVSLTSSLVAPLFTLAVIRTPSVALVVCPAV